MLLFTIYIGFQNSESSETKVISVHLLEIPR